MKTFYDNSPPSLDIDVRRCKCKDESYMKKKTLEKSFSFVLSDFFVSEINVMIQMNKF